MRVVHLLSWMAFAAFPLVHSLLGFSEVPGISCLPTSSEGSWHLPYRHFLMPFPPRARDPKYSITITGCIMGSTPSTHRQRRSAKLAADVAGAKRRRARVVQDRARLLRGTEGDQRPARRDDPELDRRKGHHSLFCKGR